MKIEFTHSAAPLESPASYAGIVSLRTASVADEAFLCDVFVSTRWDEFARTGWEPSRIDAFLRHQSQLQHTYYREHYPHAFFDVVLAGAEPVGRLYHAWRPAQLGDEVRIIDIALLPAWRGKGIGTRLLRALIAGAVREGLPVTLNVEADNPVQSLYRRLGFVKQSSEQDGGVYGLMRRECAPLDIQLDARAVSSVTSRDDARTVCA